MHTNRDIGTAVSLECFWVSPLQRQGEIRVFSRMCLLFIKLTQRKRQRRVSWNRKKQEQGSDGISRGVISTCGWIVQISAEEHVYRVKPGKTVLFLTGRDTNIQHGIPKTAWTNVPLASMKGEMREGQTETQAGGEKEGKRNWLTHCD